jgi:hypothetical protein
MPGPADRRPASGEVDLLSRHSPRSPTACCHRDGSTTSFFSVARTSSIDPSGLPHARFGGTRSCTPAPARAFPPLTRHAPRVVSGKYLPAIGRVFSLTVAPAWAALGQPGGRSGSLPPAGAAGDARGMGQLPATTRHRVPGGGEPRPHGPAEGAPPSAHRRPAPTPRDDVAELRKVRNSEQPTAITNLPWRAASCG